MPSSADLPPGRRIFCVHPHLPHKSTQGGRRAVIVLGLVLIIVGYLVGIGVLETLGLILLVVGVILAILGATPYAVGGRRWYW